MAKIVWGNVIALIASLLMVYSGIIKKKKKILFVQTVQMLMFVLSNTILGGITGSITNAVGCIRNILCYNNKLKAKEKIILIVISILLSFSFNNLGIIGFLPLISTIAYTLLMDIDDIIKFKLLIIITVTLWLIYDIYIYSYSSAIFDFMNIVANIVSIYQLESARKNKKEKYGRN